MSQSKLVTKGEAGLIHLASKQKCELPLSSGSLTKRRVRLKGPIFIIMSKAEYRIL